MSPHPEAGAVPLRQTVVEAITEILPDLSVAEITGDKNLKDLGADSVDRVEIISLLTHRLGRTEPISRFADIPNIDALIEYLSEMRGR
jgi:polyketide biosynthesis acyl carrier protein